MIFSELQIPDPLQKALADHGYATPTPVQTLVTEERCRGRDLLVSARTGSGKTIAFGLAFGESVIGEDGSIPPSDKPVAIVIAPTRELALQVQHELSWLYAPTLAHVRSCVGGMDVRREAFMLANGAHVVVGTPGRLCDHLARGRLDLSQIRTVVLDEADEMLDMGFREELETLLNACPQTRRTLMFSATLPRVIEEMAASFQRDPLRIAADPPREAHADIEYRACLVAPRERDLAVVNLLREHDAKGALVFCSTREAVSRLQSNLSERGFQATAISGELTQAERSRALKMLRDGHARVLVATDVAARGLDLPALDLVIHADPPRDAQVLQHRSGRTGRAGRKGVSVLLVPWRLRSQAERMFRQSGIPIRWHPVPTMDEIHALDRERLGQEVVKMCSEVGKEELEIAQLLLEELSPDQLAAALVRQCYAKLPAAEDLPETNAIDARTKRPTRLGRFNNPVTPPKERLPGTLDEGRFDRRKLAHASFDETPDGVLFKLSVGRQQGADPRWLIPLICKRGGIQKQDIGRIEILPRESRFYVSEACADMFAQAISSPVQGDGRDASIRIERVEGSDAFGARIPRENRIPREKLQPRRRGESEGGHGRAASFAESGYTSKRSSVRRDFFEGDGGGASFAKKRFGAAHQETFSGASRKADALSGFARTSAGNAAVSDRREERHCPVHGTRYVPDRDEAPAPRPMSRGVDFSRERKKTGAERRADIAGFAAGRERYSKAASFARPSDRFDPVFPERGPGGRFAPKRRGSVKSRW